MKQNKTGFSPVYATGKKPAKNCSKHDNYGTDTFRYAKKALRKQNKQDLKKLI